MADWMAFNVADYVANTLHLTTRQHGGYILLICAAWNGKGFLPGTDDGLRAIAKLTPKEWREDGPALKAFLTRHPDGSWLHERVAFERNESELRIEAKRKAGAEGARRRWNGRGNGKPIAVPSQPQRQTDAHLQEHLQEPVTTTPSVANSAPVGASHTPRAQLITEDWEPTEADLIALRKERPDLIGALYDARMRDFRDWCAAQATRSFNPVATWRGFMRKTKTADSHETFDQRRIRLGMEALRQ